MGPLQVVLELIERFFFYIPPFLLVLTVIVFIHELGHFLVARWCGVEVTTFSIGFGPEVFGWNDRKGTRWRVAWIPLGGYVKFVDDDNVASVPTTSGSASEQLDPRRREGLFHSKSVGQRAAIVAAGPLANFVLAIAVFSSVFYFFGEAVTPAKVDRVVPGGAAEAAGFQPGDLIIAIDGSPVESFNDVQKVVYPNADRELTFTLDRAGQKIDLKATPKRTEQTDRFGNIYPIGLIGVERTTKREELIEKTYSVPMSIARGVGETQFIVERTLGLLRDVIIGKESVKQLGGPIAMAEASGQWATLGTADFIRFIAIVSISIGLFNLFPIPILDGGNLLFYAIEAIWQRPLSERTQAIGFRIGLAILGMLMVFVMTKDILKSIEKFMGI
ncbi:MAG: RIP metalloprotease RseP [Hyphomicrobiaceae bacterium]